MPLFYFTFKINPTVRNGDISQNSSKDPATVGLHPSMAHPQSRKAGPVLAQLSNLPRSSPLWQHSVVFLLTLAVGLEQGSTFPETLHLKDGTSDGPPSLW